MLVEVGGVSHEAGTAEVLGSPYKADDFGVVEVVAFEAVEVRGSGLDFPLEFVGVHHHGRGGLEVEFGVF